MSTITITSARTITLRTRTYQQNNSNALPFTSQRQRGRPGRQNASDLRTMVFDMSRSQLDNSNAGLIESMTPEEVTSSIGRTGSPPDIALDVVMQAGQTTNLSNTARVLELGSGNTLNESGARGIVTRLQTQQNATFPASVAQSADNDDTREAPPGFLRRNAGCLVCGLISVIVVAVCAAASQVSMTLSNDLGFVSRPPGKDNEASDEDLTDKEVVALFNQVASDYGVDISQPFTKVQMKPLLKEAYDWYWLPEETFWKTKTPRDVIASERCSTENLIYQIVALNSLTPHAMQLSIQKPTFTWIDPKDPTVIVASLTAIYQEKGVNEMYDYMATYKYYQKRLRRVVALELVVKSLQKLLDNDIKVEGA